MRRPRSAGLLVVGALTAAAVLAVGCGEKKKDRAAATVAARVNGAEVSLAQVNQVLQQRGLRPDQADAAARQVLERLIDQAVAVQKAESLGLERDARTQLQLDAARREVLARAYAERVGEAAKPPTEDEVHQYYRDKPALFSQRRIYQLQEWSIEASPEQAADLRQRLTQGLAGSALVEHLKAGEIRFTAAQTARAAEQIPPALLDSLSRVNEGLVSVAQGPAGLQVLMAMGSRPQPITEEQAKPIIERLMVAERRRKLVEDDLRSLRSAAKVEYLGAFASAGDRGSAESAAQGASAAVSR